MYLPTAEGNGNGHRDRLLADLLLRLEESQQAGDRASVREWIYQEPSLARRPDRDNLIDALVRRLEALREVDAILFPTGSTREPCWPDIAGYEVLGELDRGGMSVVYLARQLALDRKVAVKVLLAGQFAGSRLRDRFRREAATVARLRHPNIAQIHDSGEAGGVPYLALELVVGGNLKTKIAGRPMPPREAARLVETIARAVEYAHQQGVVHRDLKPSNLLMSEEGIAKISDFGLAKLLEGDANLTRTGEMPGTPNYMAPEQIRGDAVGPPVDVYALGAILHETLTGRPPFAADSSVQVLNEVLTKDPPPVRRLEPGVPRDLEVICLKCLEKDAAARYGTAAAVADDLKRYLLDEPIRARRHGPLARAVKWARRHPAVAALVTVSALAVATLWGITVGHSRSLAAALRASEEHRLSAEASERNAVAREKSLRRYHYAVRMQMADQATRTGDTRQVLAELAPYADGQPESHLRGFEWYHVQKQCHLDLVTLDAHTDQVNMVAYSPDDKLLATASDDDTVRLWDGDTHRLITTLRGHSSCVNELAFAPDGKWLVTASCDHTVKMWDVKSFRELATLDDIGEPVDWVAVSPDGTTIATPSTRKGLAEGQMSIAFWDVATREKKLVAFTQGSKAMSADFSPDGAILATAHTSGSIRLWDTRTGQPLQVLHGHTRNCFRVRFSPDGSFLASSGADWNTIVWDRSTLRQRVVCRSPSMALSVSISPDSSRLVVARSSGNVEIWDATTGQRQAVLLGHVAGVQTVTFHHDGRRIASGGRKGAPAVKVWDATTGAGFGSILHLPRGIQAACFDEPLTHFVTSSTNGRIALWNVQTGRVVRNLRRGSGHHVWTDNRTMPYSQRVDCVAAESPDGRLAVWHASTGQRVASLADKQGRVSPIGFFQSEAGWHIVGLVTHTNESDLRSVAIWDGATWASRRRFEAVRLKGSTLESFAVHPQGKTVAIALSGQILLRSLSTGKLQGRIDASGWKRSLVFSDDGQRLLWGSSDGAANIWDRRKGPSLQQFRPHEGAVYSVAQSPDGKILATGDSLGNVKVWHVHSGQKMLELKAMQACVVKLQWSTDGNRLACFCREDNTDPRSEVRVWSIER